MTRINLQPPEIKEKAERPRLIPWFILMGAAVLAILVILFLIFSGQKSSKEDALKEKQSELQDLQKMTQGMAKYEAEQKELNSLTALYEQANSGRVPWAQMLNDLAMYVPEGLATASNPRAPSIWLVNLTIDAQSLEAVAGAGAEGAAAATNPIVIEGYAAPAWLCVQTWLPRASDFKAKGFLDAYPYYYYFRGHPKVAEFFVRLQNMDEWTNLWISESTQEIISATREFLTVDDQGVPQIQEEQYSDWAIHFIINAEWNPEKAIWNFSAEESTATPTSGGGQ